MLTSNKQTKLLEALKKYSKKYLQGNLTELDESGTRLMINEFLSTVLAYIPIEEIKTEYMIKGTYADYVIQLKGIRHFLVEVKALSLNLSESHLRQAINYGANEGIEWALLTNGKVFELYKIIVDKTVQHRKIFSIDFSNITQIKNNIDLIQYLYRDCVSNKGLSLLWNKCSALDPANIAGFLYTPNVINFIKKSLKEKHQHKFSDEEIKTSIDRIVFEAINLDQVKYIKSKKTKNKSNFTTIVNLDSIPTEINENNIEIHTPIEEQINNITPN